MNTATEEITEDITDETEHDTELTALQKKHYEQIQEFEKTALTLEAEYLDAKSEAKSAKELWERSVDRLRSLIRNGCDPQQELPFDDKAEWEVTPIESVLTELTDKQRETLEEANIKTVGEFEALRAGEGLTSLKGIGQVKADEWESQMLDWLAVNAREDEDEEPEGEVSDEDT